MKSFIIFALLVAAAVAAPAGTEADAQIIKNDSNNIGTGDYEREYETSNGIRHIESARLIDIGTENEGLEVRGEFSYPGNDGIIYTVSYIANRLGYQASGAHLPKAQQ